MYEQYSTSFIFQLRQSQLTKWYVYIFTKTISNDGIVPVKVIFLDIKSCFCKKSISKYHLCNSTVDYVVLHL